MKFWPVVSLHTRFDPEAYIVRGNMSTVCPEMPKFRGLCGMCAFLSLGLEARGIRDDRRAFLQVAFYRQDGP